MILILIFSVMIILMGVMYELVKNSPRLTKKMIKLIEILEK